MAAPSTANEVADFIVAFRQEHGDAHATTNLHLQKYLYYAQAWHLALYGVPLFNERLEAWVHGPVQPDVYRRFKDWAWRPIMERIPMPEIEDPVREHLEEVLEVYGWYTAWDLERLTHSEPPWREARGNIPDDEPSTATISHESMRRYFHGRLKEAEESQG